MATEAEIEEAARAIAKVQLERRNLVYQWPYSCSENNKAEARAALLAAERIRTSPPPQKAESDPIERQAREICRQHCRALLCEHLGLCLDLWPADGGNLDRYIALVQPPSPQEAER